MFNPSRLSARHAPRRWFSCAANSFWQWLRRPWLAIAAGIIVILLALAAWLLPQLPGQLADEHAAAANWLLNTSSAYGIWGNALLALGLFDVLRSPLLYLLLALLVPTLAAQLADQLGALHQQCQVQSLDLSIPTAHETMPLFLPATRPLFRWRGTLPAPPDQVVDSLTQVLAPDFPQLRQATLPLEGAVLLDQAEPDNPRAAVETRVVALRRLQLQYLRPLLMIGLLIAVAGAWLALALGWQISSPPLAPGATFRAGNRNLTLRYTVPSTTTGAAAVTGHLQGAEVNLPVDQPAQARAAAATIQVRPAYPGVWMMVSDHSASLTLPGNPTARAELGLVFAVPGSEESVLIPQLGLGLRVVQLMDSNGFVLELYRSDAIQPVYRAELTSGGQVTIPLDDGERSLIITSRPGLQIDVRHLPGLWLVPLGILLTFIGAVAFLRPSNFVVVQVAPWHASETIVVLQSDQPQLIESLRTKVEQLAKAEDSSIM